MSRCNTLTVLALCWCTFAVAHAAAYAQQPTERLDFGTAGLGIPAATEVVNVSPSTVSMIGETMLRESGTRRIRLVRDLGECRSPLALPFLRQILGDFDPVLRAQAVRSTARVGDASILPAIQPLLRDPVASVRREAVLACEGFGDDQAAAAALRDADATVISAALQATRGADAIAGRLNDLPPALRVQAIRRVGERGGSAHAATVARFLTADTGVRIAAIETLAVLNSTEYGEAVRALMRDSHPGVRRAATRALTLSNESDRGEYAVRMLSDTDPEVRQAAAEVLTTHPRADALGLLAQQLDDGDEPLRFAAREALVALEVRSTEIGAQLLTDSDARRREDGSYILGRIRSDASLDAHLALLNDADWAVVAQAAASLGRIGRPEAREPIAAIVRSIPPTAALLPREQQDAFSEVVIAAARLSVESARDRMAQLVVELAPTPQQGPAPRLRAACAWGFGMLGNASDSATCDALLAVVGEILEQRDPKVEATKALGHLRYAPAGDALKRIAETSLDPQIRWMAWWSYGRASGARMTYSPPLRVISPDVSIAEFSN